MMKGLIIASTFGTYAVRVEKDIYYVKPRGLFRKKGIKPFVGDYVEIDKNDLIITNVYDRKSFLIRPPIANISQIIIVLSLVEPKFSYLLAFKYLTYANINHIKANLVISKIDKQNDSKTIEEIKEIFSSLKINTYFVSSKTKEGLDEVKKLFKNEMSCVMGQTGVGKSSLINAIDPDYQREVGEYSKALRRGKHRTREVVLLPYQGGYIADTPGFSSLDLDLTKEELAAYFPGFNNLYNKCYFTNCLHLSENRCAVKEHLEKKEISPIVYEIYKKASSIAPQDKRRFRK
ncbi:MAG TPA: ribosome small subunit-dependent GTPase A [Erysipelotrichaceae bacterium]|nr:ribosome small subunit-dependent GTPase A [Erysipelotrichaceae bacterium]